jgi:hypothetical protein
MAETNGIYFLFRAQLDPSPASPAWARFRFPSVLLSQFSPPPQLRSGANGTSLTWTAGGDGL